MHGYVHEIKKKGWISSAAGHVGQNLGYCWVGMKLASGCPYLHKK